MNSTVGANRICVEFFVSYAHKNRLIAEKFIEDLMELLRPSKTYDYKVWMDSAIVVGEEWLEQISAARDKCSFGLLLVSPAFLGSDFISSEELPYFVGENSVPSIPVMLSKIDFELHDLKGLEELQIFRYIGKRYTEPRSVLVNKNRTLF